MIENWIKIPGHPNYEVSSLGKVRRSAGGRGTNAGKVLKPSLSKGYKCVQLSSDGTPKTYQVHRLVALAFLGSDNGLHINHINCNALDNRPENLEYCTQEQNNRHAAAHERFASRPRTVLDGDLVLWLRLQKTEGASYGFLSKKYGISKHTLADACRGKSWRHVGGPLFAGV